MLKLLILFVPLLFGLFPDVFAQETTIPLAEKMADDTEDKGIFELGNFLIYGTATLMIGGLALFALISTGHAALQAYNDWRQDRIEFGVFAARVGVALLVMCVVLLLVFYGYQEIQENT